MMPLRSFAVRCVRTWGAALSLPLVFSLSGCATSQSPDPLESWNRGVFSFNEGVDAHVLKPLAEGYVKVTPSPVQTGVRNFFGNIDDVWSSVNLFLQGRFKEGAASTMRVAVNSTLGLGGLIDLATPMRLDRYREDLGQTLGVWGAPSGAYIVWPILGPSSVRDSANLASSMTFSATTLVDGSRAENSGEHSWHLARYALVLAEEAAPGMRREQNALEVRVVCCLCQPRVEEELNELLSNGGFVIKASALDKPTVASKSPGQAQDLC